jgi:hypothetical protein
MCRIEFHAPADLFDQIPHPYPAAKAVPAWLKNMPTDIGDGGTLKRCPPFLEAVTAGYVIPAASDIVLTLSAQGVLSVDGDASRLSAHHPVQYDGAPFTHAAVIKFRNPWVIVTPPGYVCLITAPINRFELPCMPLTGIVETDSYYKEVNVPAICMMRPGQTATIARGTPLVQVIPFRREAWSSTSHPQDATRRNAAEEPFTQNRHAYKEQIWKKLEYT